MDTKAWLLAVIEHQRRETERLEREDAERTIAEVKPLIEQNLRGAPSFVQGDARDRDPEHAKPYTSQPVAESDE